MNIDGEFSTSGLGNDAFVGKKKEKPETGTDKAIKQAWKRFGSRSGTPHVGKLDEKLVAKFDLTSEQRLKIQEERRTLIAVATREFGGYKEIRVGVNSLIVPEDVQLLSKKHKELTGQIGTAIKIDESAEHRKSAWNWQNSAETVEGLLVTAKEMADEYGDMVDEVARRTGGQASFGPDRKFMLKSEQSLTRKVKDYKAENLRTGRFKTEEEAEKAAVQGVSDSVRGSLIIPSASSITDAVGILQERCREKGWDISFRNLWNEGRPGGYAAVHATIVMRHPSKEEGQEGRVEQVVAELQIHLPQVYDGTEFCAKERSHIMYEYAREAYGPAPKDIEGDTSPKVKKMGISLHPKGLARVASPNFANAAMTLLYYSHLSRQQHGV